MNDPRTRQPLSMVWRLVALVLVLPVVAVGGWLVYRSDAGIGTGLAELARGESRRLSPMAPAGPPLRTDQGGADLVYVLATQSERIVPLRLRKVTPRPPRQLLHVDLWAVDAVTAKLAWRKRLRTYEGAAREGIDLRSFDLFGADGGTLWLSVREPLAVALADGRVLADGARIDAVNARLPGKRVNDLGYVAFGRHGLQLTFDNASQWRIDGTDFSAAPRDTPARDPARIVAPSKLGATDRFQMRGLPLGERWLGVLTDGEADVLQKRVVVAGREPGERRGVMEDFLEGQHVPQALSPELRPYRLWGAHVKQVSAAPRGWPANLPDKWGTRPSFSNYAVLKDAPSFLQAGLLGDGFSEVPFWYRAPDSVLVLHRDKIGSAGRLQLDRIAGPAGRVVWKQALPFARLDAVLGKQDAPTLLFGSEERVNPNVGRDEEPVITHHHIVSLDPATGRTAVLDLTAESLRMDAVVEPAIAEP